MTRSLILALLILGCLCGDLTGQQAPLATTADPIVVTGSKTARPLSESPAAVTVIDSATVARAADLAQLLDEQAGLVVNGAYANFGKDRSLFQRNGPNAFTLILLDGQPLLDPSALDGAVDLRLLSLTGLKRIEILRGPQALLYGADAVAGVINLITRETAPAPTPPGFQRPTLHLRSAAQTHDTYEAAAHGSGRSRRLDYRLGYEYFTSQGISEAVPAAGITDDFDRDGVTRRTLSAGLTLRPLSGLTLRPTLRLADFDGEFDTGAFQDANNRYDNQVLFGSLAADYQLATGTLGASFGRTRTQRTFDFGGFVSDFDGRASQTDAYGTFALGRNGQLTVGAQLRTEAILDARTDTLRDARTLSPYLQYSTRLAEGFIAEAGLRYNNHSEFGGQLNYSLAAAAEVTESLTARLSVASAFQSPTLDQLFGPFGPNANLEPQTANSVEVGLSLRDPAAAYAFRLSLFARRVGNVIVFTDRYNNRDQLNDLGAELSGNGRLSEQLTLSGYLSYVRGTLRTQDLAGNPVEQTEFFRRPRATGRLALTYNADFPLTARLSVDYTGERPDIFFDSAFNVFEPTLDPYWLVNAYAEYRFGERENVRLFLDVRNLTDADFVEVTGFGILGRTLRGGVAVSL